MNIDTLVFAAHPDDAELGMGGTIAKIVKSSFSVGIIDITQGEMSTRGNTISRKQETIKADSIPKTSIRENLLIADGDIQLNDDNIRKIVIMIRKYSPKVIFAPYFNDRHPDHLNVSNLVKKAFFISGLIKYKTFDEGKEQQTYRPRKLYYYMQTYTFVPSFIIDISDTFNEKMESVKAYSSQFYDPKNTEPETFISNPQFIEYVEARARHYGFQIGKRYGEPFFCEEHIELDLPQLLLI